MSLTMRRKPGRVEREKESVRSSVELTYGIEKKKLFIKLLHPFN